MKMLAHNNKIELYGVPHTISFEKINFLRSKVVKQNGILMVYRSELKNDNHKKILEDWIKKYSKKIIEQRVLEIASLYNFEYMRIAVRDQRTRWGSCSSKKNLNFNWKLILTPPEFMDYVIVHELSHTRQMNHSKNFWGEVGTIFPEYKIWNKWGKTDGSKFFA